MEVNIKAIHFETSAKLDEFIGKKADKLARRFPTITVADFTLKVVKPETAMNKEAALKVIIPNLDDIVATKTADTFEEAVDLTIEAVERQLEKKKNSK